MATSIKRNNSPLLFHKEIVAPVLKTKTAAKDAKNIQTIRSTNLYGVPLKNSFGFTKQA